MLLQKTMLIVSISFLTACDGGGSSGSSNGPPTALQGVWRTACTELTADIPIPNNADTFQTEQLVFSGNQFRQTLNLFADPSCQISVDGAGGALPAEAIGLGDQRGAFTIGLDTITENGTAASSIDFVYLLDNQAPITLPSIFSVTNNSALTLGEVDLGAEITTRPTKLDLRRNFRRLTIVN